MGCEISLIRGWKLVSYDRCFQSALVSLGETLCCDEKLFRFTGKGGIVRKVPNKPARVGIRHYQAVVTLSGELPFVYTRVHHTSANTGDRTPTSMMVLEWAEIVKSFQQPTTLAMDCYYLDNNDRQCLLERGVRCVAA